MRDQLGFALGWDGFLLNGIYVAAALLCLLRAWSAGPDRVAWLALGVGLTSYAAAQVYWTVWIEPQDPEPYPSMADALWLTFYPCAYLSGVLLLRRQMTRFLSSMWLDGLIAVFGVTAASLAFVLPPILTTTGSSVAEVATNLAYPICGLLLFLMVVIASAMSGWRPSPRWWLLGVGFVMFAVGDTIYLFQVANNTYQQGTYIDWMWVAGVVLMARAAGEDRARSASGSAGIAAAIPTLFLLGSLGLLVYDHYGTVNDAAELFAAATILGAGARLLLTLREVRSLADSRRQARTDELTGLPNRRAFYEDAHRLLNVEVDDWDVLALLLVDLDRFKEVNDGLGHHMGDELLRELGPRLRRCLREVDTLARIGGDEFAILLPGADAAMAAAVAIRVRAVLEEPFSLEGVTLQVSGSIGIALSPEHGGQVNVLLRCADVAMYSAKAARVGHQFYDDGDGAHGAERLRLLEELRLALRGGQLAVHYQPQVSLADGKVQGFEALVRWDHPRRGRLSPAEFIPLAEDAGLMVDLTRAVLSTALADCRSWWDAGERVRVAVNLSPSAALDRDLPRVVRRLLLEHGLPASALLLEITEEVLMLERSSVQTVLGQLRDLGVRVSVDDYGSGYSSLAYLRELPVDELKLDKSFVHDLDTDPRGAAIVHSTVGLAHSLGLEMVAEGVETAAEWDALVASGCDLAQGYFIARPMPGTHVLPWLTRHHLPTQRKKAPSWSSSNAESPSTALPARST